VIQHIAQFLLVMLIGVAMIAAVVNHGREAPPIRYNAWPAVGVGITEAALIWLALGGWPA